MTLSSHPNSPAAAPWLLERDLGPGTGVRLFCLPHAGSGTAAYYRWKRLLAPEIEVCPVHLPGRELRLAEPAWSRAESLAAALLAGAAPLLERPYAIFGHSMGALLAYELARQIEIAGLPGPRHLFVCGRNAPQLPPSHRDLHLLPDERFVAELQQRFGGIPNGFLEDDELRGLFLPILRADLEVVETYEPARSPRLACAVTAMAGESDASVTQAGLEAWTDVTTGRPGVQRFAGGHFFHTEAAQERLLQVLRESLAG